MKIIRFLILFLLMFILSCTTIGTRSLHLRYQPAKGFSSLQTKIGATLAMAPFKDERSETLYIGTHTNLRGDSSYFKSYPFPLESALETSLSEVLSRYGVKTIPIPDWDGQPESLKHMETDAVLRMEIKRFWTEAKASLFRTTMKATVQLTISLGVKQKGKVFIKNMEIEREVTVARSNPEKVEAMINQILTDLFDSYFSNPY